MWTQVPTRKPETVLQNNYLWASDFHLLLASIWKWIVGYTDPVLPCTGSWVGAQRRHENWITSFVPLPFKIILDLQLLKLLLGVFPNCFITQSFWCWVVLLSLLACQLNCPLEKLCCQKYPSLLMHCGWAKQCMCCSKSCLFFIMNERMTNSTENVKQQFLFFY